MAPTVDLAALPTNPSIYTMDFQRTDIPVDIADDDGNSPTPALESKLNGSLPSFTLKPPSTRPLLAPSPLPPVLPDDFAHPLDDSALETAVHVLSTEADALSYLSSLYASHPVAQRGFSRAVAGMTKSLQANGKVVIVGVGKSGKIGKKIESTLNSLGLLAMFMNPVEALHGDLGILRPVSTSYFAFHLFPWSFVRDCGFFWWGCCFWGRRLVVVGSKQCDRDCAAQNIFFSLGETNARNVFAASATLYEVCMDSVEVETRRGKDYLEFDLTGGTQYCAQRLTISAFSPCGLHA